MKCRNCGKELPEESKFCNWCETDVTSYQPNETKTVSPTKAKAIMQLLIRCCLSFSVVAIIILLISLPITKRNKQFDEAKAYVLDGKYSRAADIFEDIIEHKRNEIYTFSIEHFETLCQEGNYSDASDWRYKLEFLGLLSANEFEEMGNEIDYGLAIQSAEAGEYEDAHEKFVHLDDYKDSAEQAEAIWNDNKDYFYGLAKDYYECGMLKYANDIFLRLGDYESSVTYVEQITFWNEISGTYVNVLDDVIIISYGRAVKYGNQFSSKWDSCELVMGEYQGNICALENEFIYSSYMYLLKDGDVYWSDVDRDAEGNIKEKSVHLWEMTKLSSSTDYLEEPRIGMTADEVLLSTWREPDDINKTTSAWGVREQWVYPGRRYIYLEDGIVTSIQE